MKLLIRLLRIPKPCSLILNQLLRDNDRLNQEWKEKYAALEREMWHWKDKYMDEIVYEKES